MLKKETQMLETTPTLPCEPLSPAPDLEMRQLPGWMVLGILTEGASMHPRSVPVLAQTASAAMALAAGHHADFQPVGILSEKELLDHLQSIQNHRNTFAQRA